MHRLLLLLALLLAACNDAPPSRAQTNPADVRAADPDALSDAYERLRRGRFAGDQASYAVDIVEEHYLATGDASALDSLLLFAERHPRHGHWALADLVELRAAPLGAWLRRNAFLVTESGWSAMASNAAATCRDAAGCWRDPVVMQLLMDRALDPQTEVGVRHAAMNAFAAAATLDEARALLVHLDEPPQGRVSESVYGALARYDTPELTAAVRRRLQSGNPDLVWWLARTTLVPLARHDLLPGLRAVLVQAEAMADDPDRQAMRARQELPGAIAELEAARAAGVVPGLPLDWPATPDDYEAPR